MVFMCVIPKLLPSGKLTLKCALKQKQAGGLARKKIQ